MKKITSVEVDRSAMNKNDEREAYASTTASPPPVQVSLDDSLESEYKDQQFIGGGGLISPNTDFSEEVRARTYYSLLSSVKSPRLVENMIF